MQKSLPALQTRLSHCATRPHTTGSQPPRQCKKTMARPYHQRIWPDQIPSLARSRSAFLTARSICWREENPGAERIYRVMIKYGCEERVYSCAKRCGRGRFRVEENVLLYGKLQRGDKSLFCRSGKGLYVE